MIKQTLHLLAIALAATTALGGCQKVTTPTTPTTSEGETGYKEPVPETIQFTDAAIAYRGDKYMVESSVVYDITLHTGLKTNENGEFVGPGKLMRIELFTEAPATLNDLAIPAGRYLPPKNQYSFSPFTFGDGYIREIEMPGAIIRQPRGTYYAALEASSSDFTPDLITLGSLEVKVEGDKYTIEGILVGDACIKRYFTYTGVVEAEDRRDSDDDELPNTTLTEDIVLPQFTASRMIDRGNFFMVSEPDARHIEIYLATDGIDLAPTYPSGDGKMLRMELTVSYDRDVAVEGIPDGTYKVVERISGGIDREDLVPGNIMGGNPGYFSRPNGTWYYVLDEGTLVEYACINGGTVTVTRVEGETYDLDISLTDYCDTPHSLSGKIRTVLTLQK